MKRLLPFSLLLAALCISTAAFAQKDKVVEASSRKKPAWIGSSNGSHFAVTEVGETLSAASDKCMASIRQHIINAVAVNISSVEKMASRQVTQNDLVSVMSDYSSVLMTEAAKLPYLNNISLSNAEAVYWERIYSKRTKTYRYEYSVLYPFPEQTRRQLIEAFVAIDDARQAACERLRRELDTIADIDRIQLALNELDGLYDYFFDATRKGVVETLRRNYRALYNAISLEVESEAPGACVYSLRLNGRRAVTALRPRLKSESVLEMNVSPYGDDLYMLTYDPQYASRTDINKIEVLYLFGGARVSRTIYFDPAEEAVAVRPKGVVRLEQEGEVLRGTLPVRVTGAQAELRQLVLWNPADGARFAAVRLGPTPLAGGECTVEFEMPAGMSRAMGELDVVRGSVTIYNPRDKKSAEVGFTLPYKLTTK